MKKVLKEFKEFALKGNVMDLAVGVIIGAAFTSIVDALVDDFISPLIGLLMYEDLSELSFSLGAATIRYGHFLTTVINFFIMAIVIFLLVRSINRLGELGRPKVQKTAVKPHVCPFCKSEIAQDASRCPHCTSMLEKTEGEKA